MAACASCAPSARRSAAYRLPWLRSNSGSGIATPSTAMLRLASLSRLAPRLTVTSGYWRLRCTATSARLRSAARRLAASSGESSSAACNAAGAGRDGNASRSPRACAKRGTLSPHSAASDCRADCSAPVASASSSSALACSTLARVASSGATLPAATRRPAASAAWLAMPTEPSASRTRSCATSTPKKRAITAARSSARVLPSSACASSRPRSARPMRAARLPPSSIGRLTWPVVEREALRVSSIDTASSGLGSTRDWIRSPSVASSSLPAADKVKLPASASASAASSVRVAAGCVAPAGAAAEGNATVGGGVCATPGKGLDSTAASPSGSKSLRIELHQKKTGEIRRDARRHAVMTPGGDRKGSDSGEASSRRLSETRPLRAVGRPRAVRGEAGLRHRRRQLHPAQRRHVLRIGRREGQRGDMADAAVGIRQVQLGLVLRRIGLLLLLAAAGLVPVLVVAEMGLGRRRDLVPAIRGGSRPGELERQDERKKDEEEPLHES
ncbi:hypothetical protein CBM2633_B10940 [Cupriavidus taiwanensis]|nr:hypothetical protein CBM2604_B150045 [Cupriavidus taiwanensis]SOZ31986.1 hypothetical protein CBM2609_B140044 [Cupriavidus taiwanensis]SOZ47666.1 hypothetical protein CBM2610_B120044 [Cupriavidus taiwanensis]SPA18710.1 hypothetical protein CBM2633_B10940 [Cupriavidus taiwanensis]